MRQTQTRGKWLAGLLLSVVFLYFALRRTDLKEVHEVIRRANVTLLMAAVAIQTAGFLLKVTRWKLLGREYRTKKWLAFLRACALGHMSNIFLPMRAGDFVQGYVLSRDTQLAKSYTLTSVFLARVIDLMAVVLIVLIGSFFLPLPGDLSVRRLGMAVMTAIFIIILAGLFYERVLKGALARSRYAGIRECGKFMEHVVGSIKFLGDRQVLLKAVPLTFVKWVVVYGCAAVMVMKAVGIHIGYVETLMVVAATALSALVPVSHGQIGVWEYFGVAVLSFFGVEPSRGIIFSVLSHVVATIPSAGFGLYFLACEYARHEGFRLKDMACTDQG